MSANKVKYGLENVHIAFFADGATPANPSWDDPQAIPGAVRFSVSPQGEETKFYADNTIYFTHNTNDGYTGELEVANIPDSILAKMLGMTVDSNGMLVEAVSNTPKEFALMGQIQGDKKNRRFVYYRCKANRGSQENTTKEATVTPRTDVVALTILPLEDDKQLIRGVIELSDTNAAVYNSFFNAVILPDASPATVDKTALAASIALAGTLDELEYTSGSWSGLMTALAAASAVNADADATQPEVNAAKAALDEAILKLVVA